MSVKNFWTGLTALVVAGVLSWAPGAAHAADTYEYDHINVFGSRSFFDKYIDGANQISFSEDSGISYTAFGYWQPDGEVFLLSDAKSDGAGVGIYWRIPSTGRSGLIHNTGGTDKGFGIRNKDFGENKAIMIKVGKCSRAGGKSCKTPQQYKWGINIRFTT